MQDIAFNQQNINAYDPIPSSRYPTLGVHVTAVSVSRQSVTSSILAAADGVSVAWNYPLSDGATFKVAVGYQVQVFDFFLSDDQNPGSNPIFESIHNFKDLSVPQGYINLSNQASGSISLPNGTLLAGGQYTVRVRVLGFSETGSGTINGEYFKYSVWGSEQFSVNTPPKAIGLRINGLVSPVISSDSPPVMSFTFDDPDGPSYIFRIQVSTLGGMSFTPDAWDSGSLNFGPASGTRDFDLSFSGSTLSVDKDYYWRVYVEDGLTVGGWSDISTFRTATRPSISSMKVNGTEILFSEGSFGQNGLILSWSFVDSVPQAFYDIELRTRLADGTWGTTIASLGQTFSQASTATLPNLPSSAADLEGAPIYVVLTVGNSVESSSEYFGALLTYPVPEVRNIRINGLDSPQSVSGLTPVISWNFFSEASGILQQYFVIQVSAASDFSTFVWNTGVVASSSSSITYGSTASPVIAPATLSHGRYYVRILVSDGISNSIYYSSQFAINSAPNSPTLVSPSIGAFSGTIPVTWVPASPTDVDGDPVRYSLEYTSRRSINAAWSFLAGPFDSTITGFLWDTSLVPSGNDYGVRVIANDGFCDSNPSMGGTSPVTAQGLGLTILAHPPTSPTIFTPSAGDVISSSLLVEWVESNPVSVDGTQVKYVIEVSSNMNAMVPVWSVIGIARQGKSKAVIDVSSLADGTNYDVRITAVDLLGNSGSANVSGEFVVQNTPTILDFEALNGTVFAGSSNGKLFKLSEDFWDVSEEFNDGVYDFLQFEAGAATLSINNGQLLISCAAGVSCIFRNS